MKTCSRSGSLFPPLHHHAVDHHGLHARRKIERIPAPQNQVRVEAAKFRVTVDWNGVRTFDQNLVDPAHGAKVLPALARPAGAIGLMARGHQAIQFRDFTIIEIRD